MPKDEVLKRTGRLTRMARARLFWERYAPVLALATAIFAGFLIASFSGIWERIGDPWRAIAYAISVYFIIRAGLNARRVKVPSTSEARRRVETDSGVSHRPLDTLDDRPVISRDLWPSHFTKARDVARTLKPAKGRPSLAPMDPYFLRYGLPVAVGLALMVGAGDNIERLKRSLTPSWQSGMSANDVTFEAWVDPPDYTGRPPIYFKDQKQIDIPAGSELVARISGAKDATRLKLTGSKRSRYLPLERLGPKSFETRAIISERSTARWRVGNTEKKWVLRALPDRPPVVNFEVNPRADKRDRLVFTYSFEDDYGVENLFLKMDLLSEDPLYRSDTETVNVPLSSRSVRKADFDVAALDLTKHKWAGQKVSATLIAKDGLGQIAETGTVFFTVPDKIFIEPIAKAIVEHRALVLAGQKEYTPAKPLTRKEWQNHPWFDTHDSRNRLDRAAPAIQRAAFLIDAVTDDPDGLYRDPAVYMGLRHVLARIRYARNLKGLEGIPEDLWSLAIRAEFGVLGTALEEMQEAERNLRDGMARRAPQREIDTLFERYDEAVERYIDELRRKALEEGNFAETQGGEGGGQNADEIQELLKAIEEANRLGDTEGARRALAELAKLLEDMQIQLSMSSGGADGEPFEGEMTEEMKKSLEELADLLGEQRELKDETQEAERQQGGDQSGEGQPQPGQGNSSGGQGQEEADAEALSPGELADRQEALERALGNLAENLPESEGAVPGGGGDEQGEDGTGETDGVQEGAGGTTPSEDLAEAQRAMEDSRRALAEGNLDSATDAQADAIEALRRAGRGLAEQVGENRQPGEQAEGSGNSDPLGRENSGVNDETSEADIDQRNNAERSRELLEELRRRASEQDREAEEREYLERLLKRF